MGIQEIGSDQAEMLLEEGNFTVPNPIRDIILLALAWALTLTTSTLLTTIGPLSAQSLGASDSFSAFAVGIFLIGAAVSSVPSAPLFAKFGRFFGFSVGCLSQCTGSVFGVLGMSLDSLIFVYIGCFFVGLGQGLGQFYRFSAVEVSPENLKARAITYVLSGGIIAAFLGPISADYTSELIGRKFTGSFLTIALIGVLNEITISFVRFPKKASHIAADIQEISPEPDRTLGQITVQPKFILSCTIATLAHTMMVMLMSNVTLAMDKDSYSLSTTSLVMELHFFAMFAPGFITGKLILMYGTFLVSVFGGIIFAASAVVFLLGTNAFNYFIGMILLGVGWNFSFSAGTVMLTECYLPKEATQVQAINDFILFTIAGGGSLLSGFIFSIFGWNVLVLSVVVMIGVNLLLFAAAKCYFPKQSMENDELKLSEDIISTIHDTNANQSFAAPRSNSRSVSKASSISSFTEFSEGERMSLIRSLSVA